MTQAEHKTIVVGVTGASGAVLAQAALRMLEADARVARIHLVVTDTGARLLAHELSIATSDAKKLPSLLIGGRAAKTEVLPNKDVGASIASGSYSGGCDGGDPVLDGHARDDRRGDERRFDRARRGRLPQGRPAPRALRARHAVQPDSSRKHAARAAGGRRDHAGDRSFYHQPKTIDDLVAQYVYRVLAQMGLPQDEMYRWEGQAKGKAREA